MPTLLQVVASSPRYLRVEFEAVDALPSSVDDAEFYFTPGDALVQFRCARRSGFTDFGASRRRMDSIRIALQFESVSIKGRQANRWPRNLDVMSTKDMVIVRGLCALALSFNYNSITYIPRELQNYRGVIWMPYATFILSQFAESPGGVLLLKHFPAGGFSFFIWILSFKTEKKSCEGLSLASRASRTAKGHGEHEELYQIFPSHLTHTIMVRVIFMFAACNTRVSIDSSPAQQETHVHLRRESD